MGHLNTIIKVKASSEEEAIEKVNDLLTNNNSYDNLAPFDYVSEDETTISKEITTDEHFDALRQEELNESTLLLNKAKEHEAQRDWEMQGYYLQMAGEALQSNLLQSTQRLAYDYNEADSNEGDTTYYIATDRHY